MRFISTKVHGMLDYLMGIVVMSAPWMFDFAGNGEGAGNRAKILVPVILGIAAILYSLFTNYELGVVRKLSMSTHLTIDLLSGILLAASPWLFGFAHEVYLPHLILGILEIGASLVTKRKTSYDEQGRYNTATSA